MPRGQKRAAAVKAVGKLKQDDDSEWEQTETSSQNEEEESSVSFHAEEESSLQTAESLEEDTKKPAKKTKKTTTNKKRKTMDSSDSDDSSLDDDEDDFLPSYARKTAKGGYAHTSKSRARISKANKGNTPWNKGKNRSEGVKAKIAAGVRARNRALLLKKLEKLGMTEEEWLAKKKEIKYLRERVRKAKKAAEQKEAIKKRKGKDADKTYEQLEAELSAKLAEQVDAMKTDEDDTTNKRKGANQQDKEHVNDDDKQQLLKKVFKPHVEWTRHDYDTHDGLYSQLCPTGGPGGLACCEVCSSAYSRYLNQTSQDVEVQSVHNAGQEVKECMEFMGDTCDKLQKKMQVARTKPAPLRREHAAAGVPTASV